MHPNEYKNWNFLQKIILFYCVCKEWVEGVKCLTQCSISFLGFQNLLLQESMRIAILCCQGSINCLLFLDNICVFFEQRLHFLPTWCDLVNIHIQQLMASYVWVCVYVLAILTITLSDSHDKFTVFTSVSSPHKFISWITFKFRIALESEFLYTAREVFWSINSISMPQNVQYLLSTGPDL